MDGSCEKPIPNGMVWNMVYDRNDAPGNLAPVVPEEFWRRHGEFLDAWCRWRMKRESHLRHSDDPATPTVRGQPQLYQWLVDCRSSPRNTL